MNFLVVALFKRRKKATSIVVECTAGATITAPGDNTTDHVGPPIPGVEIKLVDVSEMEYVAKDGTGEVCIRGKINMVGYYNLKDKTAETVDADGWLHTGDIGTWTDVSPFIR